MGEDRGERVHYGKAVKLQAGAWGTGLSKGWMDWTLRRESWEGSKMELASSSIELVWGCYESKVCLEW